MEEYLALVDYSTEFQRLQGIILEYNLGIVFN